jgi:hypothetical protein
VLEVLPVEAAFIPAGKVNPGARFGGNAKDLKDKNKKALEMSA